MVAHGSTSVKSFAMFLQQDPIVDGFSDFSL